MAKQNLGRQGKQIRKQETGGGRVHLGRVVGLAQQRRVLTVQAWIPKIRSRFCMHICHFISEGEGAREGVVTAAF